VHPNTRSPTSPVIYDATNTTDAIVIYNATVIADATIVFDDYMIADAIMVLDVITDTTMITDAIMVYDATTRGFSPAAETRARAAMRGNRRDNPAPLELRCQGPDAARWPAPHRGS
jgi:hypothetical protein